jgi:hypothetical protein
LSQFKSGSIDGKRIFSPLLIASDVDQALLTVHPLQELYNMTDYDVRIIPELILDDRVGNCVEIPDDIPWDIVNVIWIRTEQTIYRPGMSGLKICR